MTKEQTNSWEKEWDEITQYSFGFEEEVAIKLTGFKSPSSLKEYIKNVISQEKERWVEEMVEKFQIEGEWGKQTPFQQTVNTYIKNRGEEIRKDLLENN